MTESAQKRLKHYEILRSFSFYYVSMMWQKPSLLVLFAHTTLYYFQKYTAQHNFSLSQTKISGYFPLYAVWTDILSRGLSVEMQIL